MRAAWSAGAAVQQRAGAGRTFKQLAEEWWDGVEHGHIGKRRGKRGYSPTTLQGYERSLRHVLIPEFGPRPAAGIAAREWQLFIDTLARDGLALADLQPRRGRARDLRVGMPPYTPARCGKSHDRGRIATRRRGRA